MSDVKTFQQLLFEEERYLSQEGPLDSNAGLDTPAFQEFCREHRVAAPGQTGEPWRTFTPADRFGIALSGGGLRSATFNLGLLQGLDSVGVLRHADYLSTVSGGGYVGGFLNAWRHRKRCAGATASSGKPPEPFLPHRQEEAGLATEPEAPAIRHLREFGRFLMPRVGFFEVETWSAIVAILGGMLPALAAAAAVLATAWVGWLFLGGFLWGGYLGGAGVAAGAVLALLLVFTLALPISFQFGPAQSPGQQQRAGLAALGGLALAGLLAWALGPITVITLCILLFWEWCWWCVNPWSHARGAPEVKAFAVITLVAVVGVGAMSWLLGAGALGWSSGGLSGDAAADPLVGLAARSRVVAPWLVTAVGLLTARVLLLRFWPSKPRHEREALVVTGVLERTIARLLAAAVVWMLLSLLWAAADWLLRGRGVGVGGLGLSTAGLLAALAWLRRWLLAPPSTSRLGNLLTRGLRLAGRMAYGVAANVALAAVTVLVAVAVQAAVARGFPLWAVALVAAGIVGATLALFNPARLGLHELYRSRIARAFLGAAHATGGWPQARTSEEQPGDDVRLGELRKAAGRMWTAAERRPLHLVCCAANDLAGDAFATLSRGARSATVSPLGVAVANAAQRQDELPLSAALTASAAAFNSHMGSISMSFGPAVAFLMSALNLRLGRWVPNPARPAGGPSRWFPGAAFFLELLGWSRVDATGGPLASQIHLSDGGHFENLALYELVRRHCRYLLVSDCGADPEVAFDDLGNAIRRIREDFGIEVELDVTPLRPGADGVSRQHAVTGTVHYDGPNGFDKGRVLFFKPTLTGDEPPDVQQYQTRNRAFPHESTVDQFYDEPQWESYRRLGEHCARAVMGRVGEPRRKDTAFLDHVFAEMRDRWQTTAAPQGTALLELSARLAELDAALREHGPKPLRVEFFPELAELGITPASAPTGDEEFKSLTFLLGVVQLMEDVWLAADLDANWSHPLNAGWMAYFHRWAAAPTFRRWWPLLRPLFNARFADFMKERFDLRLADPARPQDDARGSVAELRLVPMVGGPPDGLAWRLAGRAAGSGAAAGLGCFSYEMVLRRPGGGAAEPVQVGFLCARETLRGQTLEVAWKAADLYVPPFLIGGGVIARLLDAVLSHYRQRLRPPEVSEVVIRVTFGAGNADASPRGERPLTAAERLRRTHDIEFYRSRNFHYAEPPSPEGALALVLNVRS